MSPETKTLLTTVLALPESERDEFVASLLQTLSPPDGPRDEDAFAAELGRRADEFRRDPNSAIPWSELRRSR